MSKEDAARALKRQVERDAILGTLVSKRSAGTGSVCEFADERGEVRFKVGITVAGKQIWKRLAPGTTRALAEATADAWTDQALTGSEVTGTGTVELRNGRWYAKLSVGAGRRKRFALTKGITESEARDMARAMAENMSLHPRMLSGSGEAKQTRHEAVDVSTVTEEVIAVLKAADPRTFGILTLSQLVSAVRLRLPAADRRQVVLAIAGADPGEAQVYIQGGSGNVLPEARPPRGAEITGRESTSKEISRFISSIAPYTSLSMRLRLAKVIAGELRVTP